MRIEESDNESKQEVFKEEDEKAIRNRQFDNEGDKLPSIKQYLFGGFAVLVLIGVFLWFLIPSAKDQLIRYFKVVIGLIVGYFGMDITVRFRKPTRVILGIVIAIIGALLILNGFGTISFP